LLRPVCPHSDARVVDHQAGSVIAKTAGEAEGRGGVLVPLPCVLVGGPHVDLFESLSGEAEYANICGVRVGGFADPQVQAVDRQCIGHR